MLSTVLRTMCSTSITALVVISPATMTMPVFVIVSHATRLFGSCARIASRIASDTWSAILSGWPSATDSEVNRYDLLIVPYLMFFERKLVVFNPEASRLFVQDEPPREHRICPTRRLHDTAESKEVNLLETRIGMFCPMPRDVGDHVVGRLRAQQVGHRGRARREHPHRRADSAEHRELRELAQRRGTRHADVDRQRDALRGRGGFPVGERRRVEAELRREIDVETGGLRELGLAAQS